MGRWFFNGLLTARAFVGHQKNAGRSVGHGFGGGQSVRKQQAVQADGFLPGDPQRGDVLAVRFGVAALSRQQTQVIGLARFVGVTGQLQCFRNGRQDFVAIPFDLDAGIRELLQREARSRCSDSLKRRVSRDA